MTTSEQDASPGSIDPSRFTTAAQWAQGLRELRERSGLSVRDLARAAGASPSTVGGYVSGRHLPTPAARVVVLRLLAACGVTREEDREAWLEALGRVRRNPGPRPAGAAAPFKGLAGYGLEDAEWFSGRERLTARVVALADERPGLPLVLVGASGSGKSSVLRAGLAATLAARGWACVETTPGPDPLAALDAAAETVTAAVAEGRRAVLVVDQLEELWTAGATEEQWRGAVRRLAELAATDGVVVASALRADFYAQALASPVLAEALERHQVLVGAMTREELVRAITEPAARAQLDLEPGLVELLLRDVSAGTLPDGEVYEPGALPLLSFALLQTWQRRRGRLTVAEYLGSGGIEGAVATAAEAVHDSLDEPRRELARRLFTRLVSIQEEAPDARRRVTHDEIDELDLGGAEGGHGLVDVVEAFVGARLLTAHEAYVEIAHEALLTAWPRLRGWLDGDRSGLILQRSLSDAATTWHRAAREPDLLLRGGRLEATAEWAGEPDHAAALTLLERDFLDASQAAAARERLAQRSRTRRLQVLAGALALALVGVAGLTSYTQRLRSDAELDRDRALSRQLAEAANRLRAQDPNAASQLALLGYRSAPTLEAASALLDSGALPLGSRLEGPGGPVAVAASPAGDLAVAVGVRSGMRLWRLDPDGTAQVAATVDDVSGDPLYAAAVHPSGQVVAVAGSASDGANAVHLFDVSDPRTPREVGALDVGDSTVLGLAVDPASGVLAAALTATSDGTAGGVAAWSLDADGTAAPLGAPVALGAARSVAFGPGSVLAVGTASGEVHRFAVDAGSPGVQPVRLGEPLVGPTAQVNSVAFSPDGRTLVAGASDLLAHVWSLDGAGGPVVPRDPEEPGTLTVTIEGAESWVNAVGFSPDGELLAAASADGRLRLYTAGTLELVAGVGHPGPVTAAAFTDGALVTGGADGSMRVWPSPLPLGPIVGGRTFGVAYLGADRLVGLTSLDSARVYDVGRDFAVDPVGETSSAPENPDGDRYAGTLAVSRDRTLAASGGRQGTTWLYRLGEDPDSLGEGVALPGPQTALIEAAAFTGDGSLLVTSSDDSTIAVTDVSDPATPRQATEPVTTDGIVYALAGAPEAPLVASGTGDGGVVELWDVSDPARPVVVGRAPDDGGPTLQVYALAFSPGGDVLAVGSADRALRFLDVSDPAAPRWVGERVTGPSDYVWSARWSPDGERLATASADGVVRVYAVDGPGEVTQTASLAAPGRVPMYSVAFSPDGRRIAAGGGPEAVFQWTLDAETVADRVCELVGDPLSREDWARYVPSIPYDPPC